MVTTKGKDTKNNPIGIVYYNYENKNIILEDTKHTGFTKSEEVAVMELERCICRIALCDEWDSAEEMRRCEKAVNKVLSFQKRNLTQADLLMDVRILSLRARKGNVGYARSIGNQTKPIFKSIIKYGEKISWELIAEKEIEMLCDKVVEECVSFRVHMYPRSMLRGEIRDALRKKSEEEMELLCDKVVEECINFRVHMYLRSMLKGEIEDAVKKREDNLDSVMQSCDSNPDEILVFLGASLYLFISIFLFFSFTANIQVLGFPAFPPTNEMNTTINDPMDPPEPTVVYQDVLKEPDKNGLC